MLEIVVTIAILISLLAALAIGQVVRRSLPQEHLEDDSRDVVKLGIGLVGTMAALVLGLVIAFAKSDFNDQSDGVARLVAKLMLLDQLIEHYGPEGEAARVQLHDTIVKGAATLWVQDQVEKAGAHRPAPSLLDRILALEPASESERVLKARAVGVVSEIEEARVMLATRVKVAIPAPFVMLVAFWFVFLFGCFGLLAPGNRTVLGVLSIGAVSAAGAFFLILELDQPFDGLIRISREPFAKVLATLGR